MFNEYNDRSPGAVTGMLNKLKWGNLQSRRTKAKLVLIDEINGGLVEVTNNVLTQSDRRT